MNRFFYYLLGALLSLLLALGAISYFRSGAPLDETGETAAASPTPEPSTEFAFGDTPPGAALVPAMPTPEPAPPTPTPVPWTPPNYGPTTNLTYPGFTVVYSSSLSAPLAVQYAMVGGAKPRQWPAPPKLKTPNPNLILQAGYGRGSMALEESIALYFGKEAGKNTALLTNSSAFAPPCLAGPWAKFEELEPRWAGEAGWIEVVAGPILGDPAMQTQNGITVPAAFYRAYRRSYGDTLAFIIPQTATSSELTQYVTSISAIEAATGMSIFPNTLSLEQRNTVAPAVW